MSPEDRARVNRVAEMFKAYGATEVYLFGSRSTGKITNRSDWDFAVAGLPDEVFFRAMAEACDILDSQIDLVDLDHENPFTQYLRENNELIRVGEAERTDRD
jgi:predicted nucleotidyltransferase